MIWVAFGSFLEPLGTILLLLDTISATLAPRSAQGQILGDFPANHSFVDDPFSSIWDIFSLSGSTRPENEKVFERPGWRSHLGVISGQILGAGGCKNKVFAAEGMQFSVFVELRVLCFLEAFWRSF